MKNTITEKVKDHGEKVRRQSKMASENEIDNILKNSSKAELLERLTEELEEFDKVVVALVKDDDENGKYVSLVMTLGLEHTYEAFGILEVAKQDLLEGDAHLDE